MENNIFYVIGELLKKTTENLCQLCDAELVQQIKYNGNVPVICLVPKIFKKLGYKATERQLDFGEFYYFGFTLDGCFIASGDSRKVSEVEAEDEIAE